MGVTTGTFESQGLVRAEFKSRNQLAKVTHESVWLDDEAQAELGEVHLVGYSLWATPEAMEYMAQNIIGWLVDEGDHLAPMSSVRSSWTSVARILFAASGLPVQAGDAEWCGLREGPGAMVG